jgi:hypothetical protein
LLFGLSANLFARALSRQGLLHSALRPWLQVEGVALYFLDDVFRLHFALEPPQCVFYRLAFLQSNFSQIIASNKNVMDIIADTLFVRRLVELTEKLIKLP